LSIDIQISTKSVRVLVVVQSLGYGGTERAASTYATLYSKVGCEVFIYGIYGGGPLQSKLEALSITTYYGFKAIKALANTAKSKSFDLIHVNSGGPYDPVIDMILLLVKSPKTRVVQTNVFARSDYGPKSNLVDVELLISSAGFWKWSTHSRRSMRQRPAALLPYFADETRFQPSSGEQQALARKNLGIPEDCFVFGRVGQPNENKWDSRLINTCLHIHERLERSHFLFLGCPPQIKASLDRHRILRKRTTFLPPSSNDDDIRQAYAAMDVFLHLSQIGESFGLVLVEAAQAGLPIATLATPLKDDAQGEVVTRIHAGQEAWSPSDLSNVAIDLASKKRKDAGFANKISSAANQCYGATQSIEGFQEFLREVISSEPASLSGRVFCHSSTSRCEHHPHESVDDMRLWRLQKVLAHKGVLFWLSFRILYSPGIYRLYRALQERKYIQKQKSRANELKSIALS